MPPRHYQCDFWKAVDIDKKKRILLSYPRRGGKDLTCAMFLGREAMKRKGTYWIMGPTKREAVDIYWDTLRNIEYINPLTGELEERYGSILDIAIPEEIRFKTLPSIHTIPLINGSVIKLGGTSEGAFVGITGAGFIITEYSLPAHHPNILPLLDPIFEESKDNWCIINGTQRGSDNPLNLLIESTKDNPRWYTTHQTLEDTKTSYFIDGTGDYNINPELEGEVEPFSKEPYTNLQEMIDISPHLKNVYIREFVNIPLEGGVQGYYEEMMKISEMLPPARYEYIRPVYTAWDIGTADNTAIIFFQLDDQGKPSIIDFYENNNKPISHYIQVVKNKSYHYGRHFFPDDCKQRDRMSALDIPTQARNQYDFHVTPMPRGKVKEGIEIARGILPSTRFVPETTQELQKYLWKYHEDVKKEKPCHNNSCKECGGASHAGDAFRYMCSAIHLKMCTPELINRSSFDIGTHTVNYNRDAHYSRNGEQLFAL